MDTSIISWLAVFALLVLIFIGILNPHYNVYEIIVSFAMWIFLVYKGITEKGNN